jgi:hypothetical protein
MSNPTPHVHAAIIREVAEHVASGAFEAGHYELQGKHKDQANIQFGRVASWRCTPPTINLEELYWEYRIVKTDKHPDNTKPKEKLIDWRKMPKGTMTNLGELRGVSFSFGYTDDMANDFARRSMPISQLRLAGQPNFTYWAGGECPVPKGVVVEAVRRDGVKFQTAPTHPEAVAYDWQHDLGDQDIIAYRIIGLADGWTDNPEEAV